MAGNTGAIAAAAALEAMHREEEEMTAYTQTDLNENWEFKILRSNTGAFKKPEVFQKACDEEKQAGWILVEKFDNYRLRFKRPSGTAANSMALPFDPYRTYYGITSGPYIALTIAITLALIFGIAITVLIIAT
jgi:hypothetical protein